jgi:predicted nuclease of predicted toxin-antitoxin system
MIIVVDESVSYGVVDVLRRTGHEVIAVAEDATVGMTDEQVFQLVQARQAVLLTRDYDFTNAVRFPTHRTGGILYIRRGNLTAAEEITLTQQFLNQYPPDRFSGKLVTLYKDRAWIR